jgi:hypothetical protein
LIAVCVHRGEEKTGHYYTLGNRGGQVFISPKLVVVFVQ